MTMAESNQGQEPRNLSQEGRLVGNPLVEIKIPEQELSPQAKTILWANQVLEEYNGLTKQAGKEKKKAKSLVFEAARQLLEHPENIDLAGSVWKSHEPVSQEGSVKQQSFYELVKEKSSHQAKDHWKEITSEKLTELVKTYAYSRLVQDMAEEILTSYFKGPDSRNEWISAYYTFAFAVLDLIEDQKAFNEAIKIALFDTSILPMDSDLFRKAHVSASLPCDIDDRNLQKVLVANNVIIRLSFLASEDLVELRQRSSKFLKTDSRAKKLSNTALQRAIKKLGFPRVQAINQAMIEMNADVPGVREHGQTTEGILIAATKWPSNLVYDQLERLNQKFRMVGGPKEDYEYIKRVAREIAGERDLGEVYFLDIQTPDGFVLSVAIPQALIAKRKEIVKLVLNHKFSEEEISGFDKQSHLFISHFNHTILSLQNESLTPVDRFDSQSIVLTQRKPNFIESNKHPLQALELVGFIIPKMEGMGVRGINQQLADEIKKTELRFLNKRGVRVPIDGKLKELGYTHVDFHKDANSDKVLVRIFVGDIPYTVKLDKYLNLDFEGKKLDNAELAESLRYIFLSLLRPILCEERIKGPHLPEMGLEEKEVVSRMGHLRWLPEGQRFSKTAVENFFKFESKDLFVTNMQRLEEHQTNRETTYVRPVIEKEENLPPITIHLPGILQFN